MKRKGERNVTPFWMLATDQKGRNRGNPRCSDGMRLKGVFSEKEGKFFLFVPYRREGWRRGRGTWGSLPIVPKLEYQKRSTSCEAILFPKGGERKGGNFGERFRECYRHARKDEREKRSCRLLFHRLPSGRGGG